MKFQILQIDAFTTKVFAGNPAAVCPLSEWIDDDLLQSIASENNLSETAFFVKQKKFYELRWFTPLTEVDLCGHATLASAFVIFKYFEKKLKDITFSTKSGNLMVKHNGNFFVMDFPSQPPKPCSIPDELVAGLGKKPIEVLASEDYVAVFSDENDISELKPDFNLLKNLSLRGVVVTAQGRDVDFVSRFFAPKFGIREDPVTGSTHCALAPYWSKRLKKHSLHASQISKRGGELFCEVSDDRVFISGCAVEFMKGSIILSISS